MKKVILIGINHAGTSFLRTFCQLNKEVEVRAYDRNDNISFLGCGIALWVGNQIKNSDGLFYSNKDELKNKYGVNVFMKHDIIEVNEIKKYVVVKNLITNEEFIDYYDKLIFAGGTWPIELNIEGHNLENIFISKIFQHAEKIKAKNMEKDIKDVVVIGAGYIGIELAEAFLKSGKNVTIIDINKSVLPNYFDKEFTNPLEKKMISDGINIKLNETVIKYSGNDKIEYVHTNKSKYKADIAILAVGFLPITSLIKNVKKTCNNAIIVNEKQQSSNQDIYVIGDAAAINHSIFENANISLATNAVKTGIVAAYNINDDLINQKSKIFLPSVNGTNAICVFDFNYTSTGITEKIAIENNINHKICFVKDKDKMDFMDKKNDLNLKIIYDPKTLLILGAQIGSIKANHTELIYIFSLAITNKITLPKIALMDFFFLPHFNKPINIITKAILNINGINY